MKNIILKAQQLIKRFLLRMKYPSIFWPKTITVLGALPVFKLGANSKVEIGQGVVFNSDWKRSNTSLSTVCHFALGTNGQLKIGDYTQLNGVNITAYQNVEIGSCCQIASGGLITDTDYHPVDPQVRLLQVTKKDYDRNAVIKKTVVIENNVWLGWGVVILKGTTIGANSVVGAMSLVKTNIPANVIAAGIPAMVKKDI